MNCHAPKAMVAMMSATKSTMGRRLPATVERKYPVVWIGGTDGPGEVEMAGSDAPPEAPADGVPPGTDGLGFAAELPELVGDGLGDCDGVPPDCCVLPGTGTLLFCVATSPAACRV